MENKASDAQKLLRGHQRTNGATNVAAVDSLQFSNLVSVAARSQGSWLSVNSFISKEHIGRHALCILDYSARSAVDDLLSTTARLPRHTSCPPTGSTRRTGKLRGCAGRSDGRAIAGCNRLDIG
jgi:hypothetical protein